MLRNTRDDAVAPCAAWIPYALTWDAETGEFHRIEGPRGFATYREAVEASRFLNPLRRPKPEQDGQP